MKSAPQRHPSEMALGTSCWILVLCMIAGSFHQESGIIYFSKKDPYYHIAVRFFFKIQCSQIQTIFHNSWTDQWVRISSISLMSFRTFLFLPAVVGSKDTVTGKPFRKGTALSAFSFHSPEEAWLFYLRQSTRTYGLCDWQFTHTLTWKWWRFLKF